VSGHGQELGGSFALGPWRVRRAGYGAIRLAGDGVFGPPLDRDEALRVLRAAVAAGVDHIDTAQFYRAGTVNELIREALYPYPDDLAIVSKVGVRHRGLITMSDWILRIGVLAVSRPVAPVEPSSDLVSRACGALACGNAAQMAS